jgi:hypothetical protein
MFSFPTDVRLDIPSKEFNLGFIRTETCFSWSGSPLGAFWQIPSGLSSACGHLFYNVQQSMIPFVGTIDLFQAESTPGIPLFIH